MLAGEAVGVMSVTLRELSNEPQKSMVHAKILSENRDHASSEEEVRLYASSIGIDVAKEADLLWIAKEGVSAPLPRGWQVLQDENNQIFYYNNASGQSLWEHPLDSYYRKKVEQARFRRLQVGSTCTAHSISDAYSKHSSVSTVAQDGVSLVPIRAQHTSTPAATTWDIEKAPHSDSNVFKPTAVGDWASVPLLGEGTSTDKGQCTQIPLTSGSEKELLTEYRELVPSVSLTAGSKTLPLCHSTASQQLSSRVETHTTASQTDDKEATTIQNGTPKHSTGQSVTSCDLTLLQTRLRTSLLSNCDRSSPLLTREAGQTRSFSLFYSPKRMPLDPLRNSSNTPKQQQRPKGCVRHLDSPLSKPVNHVILAPSPDSKPTESDGLPFCPELGESPTERKADQSLTVNMLSAIEEHPNSMDSHTPKRSATAKSTSILQIGENPLKPSPSCVPPTLSIRRSLLTEQHPAKTDDSDKHTPEVETLPGFNEGIGHLFEERARLQRKMLRIKLVYKTYKQRLASLDASLNVLQQRSSTTSTPVLPTPASGRHVRASRPSQTKLNHDSHVISRTHLSPGDSPSSESVLAYDFQANTDGKLEVIDIREGPIRSCSTGLKASALRKPYRSLSVTRHTAPSWFSPATRHTPSSQRQPSTSLHSRISSGGGELAHSLASIDAQLHYVMHQLESNEASAVCDRCIHEKHTHSPVAGHTVVSTVQSHCKDTKLNQLQYGFANLSLNDPALFGRKSCMTDLRLLTPVSQDDDQNGFQKPYLDGSPTWLNSD
ncbi:centrosomal protein of 164 kDa [Clonorchis sinensis]|uniref:Centrosomal protein of 164 kDa n=1 Tax=Clonorchis sinensis TaxID=79923 RepID=H2KUR5_CLOSI|nr:centrosomal protein of 164 kDa [Clonorchis sinensis]